MGCIKENPRRGITRTGNIAYRAKLENGEGGIRTLDTGINPYNGLANRRFRPLSHLSKIGAAPVLSPASFIIITNNELLVLFVLLAGQNCWRKLTGCSIRYNYSHAQKTDCWRTRPSTALWRPPSSPRRPNPRGN